MAILPIWLLDEFGLDIIKRHLQAKKFAIMYIPMSDIKGIKNTVKTMSDSEKEIIRIPFVPEREGEYFEI